MLFPLSRSPYLFHEFVDVFWAVVWSFIYLSVFQPLNHFFVWSEVWVGKRVCCMQCEEARDENGERGQAEQRGGEDEKMRRKSRNGNEMRAKREERNEWQEHAKKIIVTQSPTWFLKQLPQQNSETPYIACYGKNKGRSNLLGASQERGM